MTTPIPTFHVAGVLVQAMPAAAARVGRQIAGIEGAVVHAADPSGTLVVTLESQDQARILRALGELQSMQGVMSAVLVSEHSEPLSAADEEFPA